MPSENAAAPSQVSAVKVVVAGGFGVGKTTFIGAVSEVRPLTTEAAMTEVSKGIDDISLVGTKTTTTVAMDFGRISIDPTLILYLFGTPGQERFGFMWDDLAIGAIGGVALVDTRRIDDSFVAIDWFEAREVPFVVAVNPFEGAEHFELDEIREALGVDESIPVLGCDARSKGDVKEILLGLLEHLVTLASAA